MQANPPQLPPIPREPVETPPERGPGQQPELPDGEPEGIPGGEPVELPDPGQDTPVEMPPMEPDYPGMPPLTD